MASRSLDTTMKRSKHQTSMSPSPSYRNINLLMHTTLVPVLSTRVAALLISHEITDCVIEGHMKLLQYT